MDTLHIGVLALQGAFREHRIMLERCGAEVTEIRGGDSACAGLEQIDGLVIPGGESTTMGRLLTTWNLLDPVKKRALAGMPVYGSCAGLILLCREVEGPDGKALDQPRLGLLNARVRRNAFGRQQDSFETTLSIRGVAEDVEAVFIRAPVIVSCGPEVEVLSRVEYEGTLLPAAVRQGHVIATAFHPELTSDSRFHEFFLSLCRTWRRSGTGKKC